MKRVVARATACGVLLVLPSCSIPKLRVAEPAPNFPSTYTPPSSPEALAALEATRPGPADFKEPISATPKLENSGRLSVEVFYTDPMLARLIQQGLALNRELKMMNEEVEVAKNEVMARQGAYLPFVTVGANAGLDRPSRLTPLGQVERQLEYAPGKRFPDPLPDLRLGLNLLWHPDLFKALHNAMYAAEQRYFATSEKRNDFVTRLIADIAEGYYRLLALDNRIDVLNQTIALQQQSLQIAMDKMAAGRGNQLPVQRFQAEVQKNQSELLIANQEIVEVQNRLKFLANRPLEPVERTPVDFIDLTIHTLDVGVPAQLLQNRPDIRQAEREIEASGLDVKVARAHFFPDVNISGAVGYQAFNPRFWFTPDALAANLAGDLVAPLINKKAIKAEYMSANARQLEAVYNYQRLILNAYTEVLTRVSMVENYRKSIEIKKQQLESLKASVATATNLFQNARAEYVEVLLAQRDLLDARTVLIETKRQQLSAVVNTYQALGGGGNLFPLAPSLPPTHLRPYPHPAP